MAVRLVLGEGSLVEMLVGSLDEQPGSVRVGTADETLASTLREEGVAVEVGDPTEADFYQPFDGVEVVICFDDSYEANLHTARTVRAVLEDICLVSYTGEDGPTGGGALADLVDQVVDPVGVTAQSLLDRVGNGGRRLRELLSVLRDIDRLAVVAHDNPDPDAIASGVALARFAESAGCLADVCYWGEISHQENRAFVNVLDLDLVNLDEDDDVVTTYDGIALVDHARAGVNNQLPPDADIHVVIDHHPPRAPVNARFVDLRSGVGATSTLMADYLGLFRDEIDEDVATALLFGIHVDTDSFSRGMAREDFEAAGMLVEYADLGTLERIESPRIDAGTFETIASAISNRTLEGEVVLSFVDHLSNRDALAQAADRMMTLEGITTTIVYGVMDGTIYVSARSRSPNVDIGETLRTAFARIGSAGGHVDMAGAQIELGILEAVDERDESLGEIVESVVSSRFLEAITESTGPQFTGLYSADIDVTDEYLVDETILEQLREPVEEDGSQDKNEDSAGNGRDSPTATSEDAASGSSDSGAGSSDSAE